MKYIQLLFFSQIDFYEDVIITDALSPDNIILGENNDVKEFRVQRVLRFKNLSGNPYCVPNKNLSFSLSFKFKNDCLRYLFE